MNKNIPIFFVCLKLSNGGSERVLSLLANEFANEGYDVTFIILFKSIRDYKLSEKVKLIDMAWENPCFPLKYLYRIKQLRHCLNQKNAIVISFLFRTIFWVTVSTMFLRIKRIYSERNDPRRDPNMGFKRLLRDLCYIFADRIVFQTHEQLNYYPGFIRNKGIIIGNPIIEGLPMHNPMNCKKIIISVCRLEKQKNLYMAIDAFAEFHKEYSDYEYHIYGRGKQEDSLKKYIRQKNLENSIKLKGFSNEVHEKMKKAMIFVSSSYYEGISNSVLEALSIGLPVVCTDCPIGGNRVLIKNKINGILVRNNDIDDMARALEKIAADDNFRMALSQNALKVRDTYSVENVVIQWKMMIDKE